MQSKTLIIQNQPAQKLSSQQQIFNRNIKKVETLQRDLVRLTQQLDRTMAYYVKDVLPVVEKKRAAGKELLVLFYGFLLKPNFLRPHEKRTLKKLMKKVIDDFLSGVNKEPEADIKKIFHVIFGSSYEEAKKEAFDEMKMEMSDLFDEMGVDMNIDHLEHNMTEEEMARYLHGMKEEMQNREKETREQTAGNTKGETKQQLKQRLARGAQDKSISTIYKTLAKALHPDLERDESKRGQKEELMKQVTAAYQNKDLHTLLKLELEVLHSEEQGGIDKLSNEKIKAYNELLREQIEGLKIQVDMLPQHPKYSPLLTLVHDPSELLYLNLTHKIKEWKLTTEGIQETLTTLQGNEKDAERELRVILKEAKYVEKIANNQMERIAMSMESLMRQRPNW